MSAREPVTDALIVQLLIGVTPGDWNIRESSIGKGGQLVAPTGVVGGVRSEVDLRFLARAADIAEYALRMTRERDHLLRERECDQKKLAEQRRRIRELELALDAATRTDETEDFAAEQERALGDMNEEH